MFFRSILAIALSAVTFVYADDISRDVVVADGTDLTQFCSQWDSTCTDTVGVSGTPASNCTPDSADTASVYCMSVYGDDAGETTDLTEDNAQAMGVQFL
ncbi:uncharacterized protein STEHIDRAFT_165920 [Stereum hirsutum FP-91666 SS1]|uniref:uncharacterized protein n=1 Tax=Stereum hirsutum (strain FP-91666) TaxID=721885 RepID=UPI000440B0B3|nr:uncharacterized protein STEHIDRAFT_165920 [Stereum hirsutum FP-91666 SS1]EIM89485.1 hypothetical protein STEHIDRAFT_165920 [Stereum hirsutum FP-91666 SS1]